jgi:ketosteroid isomerase-like protein
MKSHSSNFEQVHLVLSMVVFAAVFLSSCAGPKCGRASLAKASPADLMRVDTEFAARARAGLSEAFREYAATEAISLPMGEAPVHGRDAVANSLSALPPGELNWTPMAADVAQSGDLGYTWGTYIFRARTGDGQPKVSYGKYVTVWKRQPDGSWKFIVDIGNTSPPPP